MLGLLGAWNEFRNHRDLRGGMLLGLALVRPQLVLVAVLVLLWQRRWAALAGFAICCAAAATASLAVVGWTGLVRYGQLLLVISRVHDMYNVHPQSMMCWRGLVCQIRQTSDAAKVFPWWSLGVAMALVALAMAWRGRWHPSSPSFDLQWALTIVVTVFCSPHLHTHDCSLLLIAGVLTARFIADGASTVLQKRVLIAVLGLGELSLSYIPLVGRALVGTGRAGYQIAVWSIVPFLLAAILVLAVVLVRHRIALRSSG